MAVHAPMVIDVLLLAKVMNIINLVSAKKHLHE